MVLRTVLNAQSAINSRKLNVVAPLLTSPPCSGGEAEVHIVRWHGTGGGKARDGQLVAVKVKERKKESKKVIRPWPSVEDAERL